MGFPHSDICGSMLACQLPAAFRRLPRPSSPVIAKASTVCTYSLDPITLASHRCCSCVRVPFQNPVFRPSSFENFNLCNHNPCPFSSNLPGGDRTTHQHFTLCFFPIVKEHGARPLDKTPQKSLVILVEDDGIEPTTPCLQSRCSPI